MQPSGLFNSPALAVHPDEPRTAVMVAGDSSSTGGWRLSIGGVDAPFEAMPVRSMMAVSDDGGETWTEPIDLLDAAGMEDVYGSNAVVDPSNGNLYVTWSQGGEERSDPANVFFVLAVGGLVLLIGMRLTRGGSPPEPGRVRSTGPPGRAPIGKCL